MKIFTTTLGLQQFLKPIRFDQSIGFVATMGALHQGHVSLAEQALLENDWVVVSIFVNPTQFDNHTDLEKYPRMLDADIALLEPLGSNVVIFSPEATALYAGNVHATQYNFGNLATEMEGKHRIGHFDGVGTVLNLFFRAIQPDRAYFGKKDYQQLQVVKKLVEIEKLPVSVIGCEIVREPNGVAMSSRNKRLSAEQLDHATILSKALKFAQKNFDTLAILDINEKITNMFKENEHVELEYFEIANANTLVTATRKKEGVPYRGFIAAFIGGVRLIDNMELN